MKLGVRIMAIVVLLCAKQLSAQENKWTSGRADGHAPIGVMGDHVHHKNEWMISYRFMNMQMEGNLQGRESVSNADIYDAGYMVAPKNMFMQMHMLGFMFAPSDKVTLYVMGGFLDNTMQLKTKMGMDFDTSSKGFGDVKVGALYQLFNKNKNALHLNFGVSIPAGSLRESGVTPMSSPNEARLGYAMQLGTGSWDASLGATYLKQYENMSFGLQSTYVYRIGENAEGYTLGDKWNTSFWTAYKFSKEISSSLRVNYMDFASMSGKDAMFMNPMMATVFDAANSGKKQLNLSVGGNIAFFEGGLNGIRIAGEFGVPLSQDVTGVQMGSVYTFTLGLQYAFGGH